MVFKVYFPAPFPSSAGAHLSAIYQTHLPSISLQQLLANHCSNILINFIGALPALCPWDCFKKVNQIMSLLSLPANNFLYFSEESSNSLPWP
jgi:hypothetical protein